MCEICMRGTNIRYISELEMNKVKVDNCPKFEAQLGKCFYTHCRFVTLNTFTYLNLLATTAREYLNGTIFVFLLEIILEMLAENDI